MQQHRKGWGSGRRVVAGLLWGGALVATAAVHAASPVLAPVKAPASKGVAERDVPQSVSGRRLELSGPNVTRWGVVGPRGTRSGPPHGLTGERLFVEGRDLDPQALRVELRIGSRSRQLAPRVGGSSSRVEFDLPPDAITGALSATVTARQAGGSTALSEAFAVCDRPRVTAITPASVGYDARHQKPGGYFGFPPGRALTLQGECLSGLMLPLARDALGTQHAALDLRVRSAQGNGAGSLLLSERPQSVSDQALTYGLLAYRPTAFTAQTDFIDRGTVEGHGLPDRVALVVGADARLAAAEAPPAATTAAATPLPALDAVASMATFTGKPVPYVFTQIDDPRQPFAARNRVEVKGRNLKPEGAANTLTWRIGNVEIRQFMVVEAERVVLMVPANAVSGPICVQAARQKQAICHPQPITVVPAYRFTSTPGGLNPLGDGVNLKSLPVRQRLRFDGFDLTPAAVSGLNARLFAEGFSDLRSESCDLMLQVHRLDPQRIEFSFGTPGAARPDGCDAAAEAAMLRNTGRLHFMWEDPRTGAGEGRVWRVQRVLP